MSKDPALKLAHKRLLVLQLAEALGNVSEACRRGDMDRSSFYEYKRRFQTHGIEGLKDMPPIHKTHPQTTPPEVVQQVLDLSLANPKRGCVWLSDMLKLRGVNVSSPTIQDILAKHGMGKRYERLLKLEERAAQEALELTPEQVALIEKPVLDGQSREQPLLRRTPRRVEPTRRIAQPKTPFTSAGSKAWAASTCTWWWTPMAAMLSAWCTPPSSPKLPSPSFTTMRCPSTRNARLT
jgi:hypothetical protein